MMGIAPLLFFLLAGICRTASAQTLSTDQLVRQVINNELYANQNDHSRWMYLDSDTVPGKSTLKLVVQTLDGTVSKTIRLNGRPLTPQERSQDAAKMESVVNDPAVRERQRKNGQHDDQQSVSMMKMLPQGFIWTNAGEANGDITLRFKPNPAFTPPTYAARVFAAMAGEVTVDAKQKRVKMLSGHLVREVDFGWGILGKIVPGGTFRVIRTEVAPGEWEITETHVHIQGHMLIFKSISQQEDEVSSHYKATPAGLTLRQAAQMLTDNTIAKELGIALENSEK